MRDRRAHTGPHALNEVRNEVLTLMMFQYGCSSVLSRRTGMALKKLVLWIRELAGHTSSLSSTPSPSKSVAHASPLPSPKRERKRERERERERGERREKKGDKRKAVEHWMYVNSVS